MSQPLVSVVMPVRNVERFLAESIESILAQTYRDFEFIIVDFGSTDSSRSIVSRFAEKDERIRPHQIPSCSLPIARNAGSQLATGKYIAVMDADDIAQPHRLTVEVAFLEQHPEVALLGGAVEWLDDSGQSLGVHGYPLSDTELKLELQRGCPFWHPTILVRRDAFERVGGYRAAFVFAHDYDLELRIADRFECWNLEQVVLRYRVHSEQITIHKRLEQTRCRLAARASAKIRVDGGYDPLDSIQEITPGMLEKLGVSESELQQTMAKDCWNWVRHMTKVGGYAAALNSANHLLRSKLPFVDRWQISELHLAVARINWKQKEFRSSILAFMRAVMARPELIGRPLLKLTGDGQFLQYRDPAR